MGVDKSLHCVVANRCFVLDFFFYSHPFPFHGLDLQASAVASEVASAAQEGASKAAAAAQGTDAFRSIQEQAAKVQGTDAFAFASNTFVGLALFTFLCSQQLDHSQYMVHSLCRERERRGCNQSDTRE